MTAMIASCATRLLVGLLVIVAVTLPGFRDTATCCGVDAAIAVSDDGTCEASGSSATGTCSGDKEGGGDVAESTTTKSKSKTKSKTKSNSSKTSAAVAAMNRAEASNNDPEAASAAADAVWADYYDRISLDGNDTTELVLRFYGCPMYSDEFGIGGGGGEGGEGPANQKSHRPYSKIPTEEIFSLFDTAYYHSLDREAPPRDEEQTNDDKQQQQQQLNEKRPHHYGLPTRGMHVPYEVRWDPLLGRTIHATTFIPKDTKVWSTSHTGAFPRTNGPWDVKYKISRVQSQLPKVLPELFPKNQISPPPMPMTTSSSSSHSKGEKGKNGHSGSNLNPGDYDYIVDNNGFKKLNELVEQGKTDMIDMEIDLSHQQTLDIINNSTFTTYRAFIEYLHENKSVEDETYDWACDALMWTYSSIDEKEDQHICVNFDVGAMFNDSRERKDLETVEGRGCDDNDGWIEPFTVTEAFPREFQGKVECLCFAFFAKRDIQPGEEFRYDYEYFGNSTDNDESCSDDDDDYHCMEELFDDDEYEVLYVDENGNPVDIHDGGKYEIIGEFDTF